jgi:hypothetical protein
MSFLNNSEQQAQKNETTLKNLIREIEHMHQETQKLFSDLNICPDQFEAHIDNPENFTQAEWERLQDHKKKLDQKLDLSANNQSDPIKTRNAFSDLHNSRNWLFVR